MTNVADKVLLAYYKVPPAGGTALPGTAEARVSTIFGWALGIVGILAVLGLIAAGISFMHNQSRGQSTDAPMKVGMVLAGVIVCTSAIAVVTAIQ